MGLIYCSLEIEKENYCLLPGVCGLDFLKGKRIKPSLEKAQEMVQKAVLFAIESIPGEEGSIPPWPSSAKAPMLYPIRLQSKT